MKKSSFISLIFLAGGKGTRFRSKTPKQFTPLKDKPIALYSFETFKAISDIKEIVVVCEAEFKNHFTSSKILKFAKPGARRQDSVYNALSKISAYSEYVCIHDSARPFINEIMLEKLFAAASTYGAAALGTPVVNTIKQCNENDQVLKTIPREHLWAIQTPQVIRTNWLIKGYEYINKNNLTVTDDTSIIEKINLPVQIVPSIETNFKITTAQDLLRAEQELQTTS